VKGDGGASPRKPPQAQAGSPLRTGAGTIGKPAVPQTPARKILFLLILSLAITFSFLRGLHASLIFGLLLVLPMIGSRLFRRLLVLVGMVIAGFFGCVLLYELSYHVKDQGEVERGVRASEQAKASEQLNRVEELDACARGDAEPVRACGVSFQRLAIKAGFIFCRCC